MTNRIFMLNQVEFNEITNCGLRPDKIGNGLSCINPKFCQSKIRNGKFLFRSPYFIVYIFFLILVTTGKVHAQKTADDFIASANVKDSLMDYKGALADFSEALKIEPANVDAYYYRAYVKFEMKDYEGALDDYNQAAEIDSADAETYYQRGNVKFEMQNYDGAEKDYSLAISINPKFAEAFYNRAITKFNLGKGDEGCRDLETALKHGDEAAKVALDELCR